MCPSSNKQTKAMKGWKEYPFREFCEQGLKVSVNTDNRTVTGTTISRELKLLEENCRLTSDAAKQLMLNAVETAFAPDEVKQILWRQIISFQ